MGNRAVICTEEKDVGVYLHWNGGRDSVEAFLAYCNIKGFRSPETDCYGWARLCQVIANFFGGDGLSIGVDKYECLDTNNYNNGTYVIKDWKIVDRLFFDGCTEQNNYDLKGMLKDIRGTQPESMQITDEEIEKYCEAQF